MGKELKVVEYELKFGSNTRTVNVFSLFKHKKSNNLYVIYSDVNSNYPIVYYGSSYIKNNSILSMSCKPEEVELIKEFIFKTIEKQEVDEFENIPLDNIDSIEIIASNHLEVKPEVINSLVDLTIPKKEERREKEQKNQKKGNPIKFILIIIIISCLGFFGYNYYISWQNKVAIAKTITCKKTSTDSKLKAVLYEDNTYQFNVDDILEKVEKVATYQFQKKEDYENFIYNGTIYKYIPEDDSKGGYNTNDEELTFKTIRNESITDDYDKPTNYEEVLKYYKNDGYDCEEDIVGE